MNYYDTYTGYVQPLPENQNNHASNTYRQYDEYDGSPRQDDLVRYLYKYPSLVCTYDPWTNSVMAPSTSTSSKQKKNKTNYPNTPVPKSPKIISKSPKSPKSQQSSSSPPPVLVQPEKNEKKEEKKEINTEDKTEDKTEEKEEEKSKSPFSVENIFSSVWDFLKSPF